MKKPGFLYRCLVSLAYRFVRLLLSLRYNIQVKGLPNLMALRESRPGILFLPNHPAEIDPVILQSLLGPLFFPRSVVVEHFYHLKGFKILLDLARVVPVPSMAEKANRWRAK
ncbi:MAG: hypothetical protein FJZ58_06580, partial [Chlamydiae bacterium]|nr:hypothetical protein [Chlamydiota bacterium]